MKNLFFLFIMFASILPGNASVNGNSFPPGTCPMNPVPVINGPGDVCIGSSGVVYSTSAGMNNYSWTISAGGFITPPEFCLPFGNTLDFDGSNDYVRINNSATSADFTIEAWIFTNTSSLTGNFAFEGNGILYSDKPGNGSDFTLAILNNKLAFFDGNGPQWTGGFYGTETDGTSDLRGMWHHVAVVRDGGNEVKLYVDGILEKTGVAGSASLTAYPYIMIGGNTWDGRYFDGKIDEVRIWNKLRTQADIQQSMYSRLTGNEPYIVSYYTFDQGIQCGNNAGVTVLDDLTSLNNDGMLNNFALNGNQSNWVLGNDHTIAVKWSTTGSQTIALGYLEGGTAVYGSKNIMVHALPVPGITGPQSVCTGSTVDFTTEEDMLSYIWSVSPGGLITAGNGSFPTGNALAFDGTYDYVSTNNLTGPDFTAEAWIYTEVQSLTGIRAFEGNPILWSDISWTAHDFTLAIMNNKLAFWDGDGNGMSGIYWGTETDGTTDLIGDWHHIAVVRDAGTGVTLYVDGIPEGTGIAGTAPLTANPKINMGGNTLDNLYFNGKIDEVRIWNIARTQSEIQQSMNMILSGSEPNLISYYRFDQGNPGGNNTGIATLPDLTSSHNNGTLYNFDLTGSVSNWIGSNNSVPWSNTISTSWNTTGPQWVMASYTSQYGCPAPEPAHYDIVVNSLPEASISVSSQEDFCNGTILTGHSSTTENIFEWFFGSVLLSQDPTLFLNIEDNQEGDYKLWATDLNGCRSPEPAIYAYLPEDLTGSYTILAYNEVQLGESNTVETGSVGIMNAGKTAFFKKDSKVIGTGSFVKAPVINAHPTAIIMKRVYARALVTLPQMLYNTTSGISGTRNIPDNSMTTISDEYINIKIGKNCVVTITGSVYGSIEIDKGSDVTFTAATLDLKELVTKTAYSSSRICIQFIPATSEDVKVRVKKSVSIEKYAGVNPVTSANPDPVNVIFYIGSQGEYPGELKVKGEGDVFNASAMVPGGQIHVMENATATNTGTMTGKFIADKVISNGKNIKWNWRDCNASAQAGPLILPGQANEDHAEKTEADFEILPVPNDGRFILRLYSDGEEMWSAAFYNSVGSLVYSLPNIPVKGITDKAVDLRPLSSGLYYGILRNEDKTVLLKFIVTQ